MWTKRDPTEACNSAGSDVSAAWKEAPALGKTNVKIRKEIISHKCESLQLTLTQRSVLSFLPSFAASNDCFLNPATEKWSFNPSWRSLLAQQPSSLTFKIDRVWCGFNWVLNVSRLLALGATLRTGEEGHFGGDLFIWGGPEVFGEVNAACKVCQTLHS